MKITILIVFNNNAGDINENVFNALSNCNNQIQLCLINNGSEDTTLEKLQELKNALEIYSAIIDIKQNKGNNAAVKAGERFLFNKNKSMYVVYVYASKLKLDRDLSALFNATIMHKKHIMQFFRENKINSPLCMIECLCKLEILPALV